MVKRLIKVGLALLLSVSFCVPVFASGYSFEHDGSASGESFNGTNKIQTDGIHVGTDPVTGFPVFETVMINQDNTYSGTNTIFVEDTLGNGYDYSSTYNGTLDVTSNDTYQGALKTVVSDANVNAVTSVSASDILDNEYNAGVTFSNSTFNKDVTVTNSNVAVSSESNVILGSIPQMESLINKVDSISNLISNTNTYLSNIFSLFNSTYRLFYVHVRKSVVIIYDNLSVNRYTTDPDSRDVLLSNNNGIFPEITYRLTADTEIHYSYDSVTHTFSYSSTTYYGNFLGILTVKFRALYYALYNLLRQIFYSVEGYGSYRIYNFSLDNQYYSLSSSIQSVTLRYAITNYLNTIINLLHYFCTRFYEWYYPLDGTAPYYWRTYNSDTDTQESVNLARVLYDISWYLGHITIGDDIKTEVKSLSDNLTSYQNAEQGIQNRISSSIQSFVPDITLLSGFVAISWVSNYLQQVYVALGSYGTVIMIGLLLGVCMQFIGYFRYKY